MRIGIDVTSYVSEKGGISGVGQYIHELVLRFSKSQESLCIFYPKGSDSLFDLPTRTYRSNISYISSHLLLPYVISKEGIDVFHGVANTLPLHFSGNGVVTVHDLAILHNRDWFANSYLSYLFSTKVQLAQSFKKAKRIIAVSHCTKKDIADFFDISADKIDVVYHGVDHTHKVIEKQFPYFLFLATIEPRKNLMVLLYAYERYLKTMANPWPLYIAGKYGWKCEQEKQALQVLTQNYPEHVKYFGYVTQEKKWELLQQASGFIFPSWYEGFGMPVLEAMSVGVPIITSKKSSLPEVSGDAALYINPSDQKGLENAMKELSSDSQMQTEFSLKSKKQSQKFSWEKCAEETLQVYKKCI